MENIPNQEINPEGLHRRYFIQKIVEVPGKLNWSDRGGGDRGPSTYIKKPVDKYSEYFVMRLDAGGKDKTHINACRKAVLHYAELIKDHLPELSKDLIERYSNPINQ